MNSKGIVSMIGAAAVAASMALSSLPVCAAVTTMPDGGQFDAAYYAATYPDVAAALGTDANALYQHYKTFGVKEGRLPYAAGTAAATTTAQSTQMPAAVKKAAQAVLRQYQTSKSSGWKNLYEWRHDNAVVDPCYAITDLNSDGIYELYISYAVGVNSLDAWDFYTIDNKGVSTYIGMVSGYNPTLGAYDYQDEDGYSILTVTGTRMSWVMSIMNEYSIYGTEHWESYKPDGSSTRISTEEVQAITAAFLPINNLTVMKALTKANINDIK